MKSHIATTGRTNSECLCRKYERGKPRIGRCTLTPSKYLAQDTRPDHVFTVFRGKSWLRVDSYAIRYKLRVNYLTHFGRLRDLLLQFLSEGNEENWKAITGVNEVMSGDPYNLEIIGYDVNLNIDVRRRRTSISTMR